ncbi:hypothetical protein NL676_033170 [Syzygium grande]|nr:hypothetical protein NL676_033170 [Syzygium grande]
MRRSRFEDRIKIKKRSSKSFIAVQRKDAGLSIYHLNQQSLNRQNPEIQKKRRRRGGANRLSPLASTGASNSCKSNRSNKNHRLCGRAGSDGDKAKRESQHERCGVHHLPLSLTGLACSAEAIAGYCRISAARVDGKEFYSPRLKPEIIDITQGKLTNNY